MHSYGYPEPDHEVRQRVLNPEYLDRDERRKAKKHAEEGVEDERSRRDEEQRGEILCLLVDDVARGDADPEEARVEDRELAELAEKQVARFMDDDPNKDYL